MTNIDQQLFLFLEDRSSVSNTEQCDTFLMKRQYSDINTQDPSGNTFLHYSIASGMIFYIHFLLDNGADPTIKNKNGTNAFQMNKTLSGVIQNVWEKYEQYSFNDFLAVSKKYDHNFKQTVFNRISKNYKSSMTVIQIEGYLKKLDLNSNDNQITLLCNLISPNPIDFFKTVFSLKRSNEKNSVILQSIFQHINTALWSNVPTVQKSIIKFINKSKFAHNEHYLSILNNSTFYDMETDFEFLLANSLLNHVIKDTAFLDNLRPILNENNTLNTLYINKKLQSDLNNKEHTGMRHKL